MNLLTDLLLAVAVAAVWLGCLGFARVHTAFSRLHAVGFVGIAAGPPVLLAAWLSQGSTASIAKLAFLVACIAVNGAALNHATGRALYFRSQDDPE